MKTIYHFLFFSLWVCLWMVGCSDKGEPIVDEPVVVPTITLSGAGSCTFASSGGTETLSLLPLSLGQHLPVRIGVK